MDNLSRKVVVCVVCVCGVCVGGWVTSIRLLHVLKGASAVGVLDQDVVIAAPLLKCVGVLHAAATAVVDAADFSVRRGSARAAQRRSSG